MRKLYKPKQISYFSFLILFFYIAAILFTASVHAADDDFVSKVEELTEKNIQKCVASVNQQADDASDASQRFYDTAACYLCVGCDITLRYGEGFQSDNVDDLSISEENYEISYKLLQQAAELGSNSANYALAIVLYVTSSANGALTKDKIYLHEYEKFKATDEYIELAKESNSEVMLKRESKLRNEVFLKKHEFDYSNEIHMRLLVAAQRGHIASQFALGEVYSRGIGVAPNSVQAYAWSATAVAQDPPFGSARRDQLANNMDAFELNEAESLAESFMKQYTSIFERSSVTVMR